MASAVVAHPQSTPRCSGWSVKRKTFHREFSEQQRVMFNLNRGTDWSDYTSTIQGDKKIIHLRFLLPATKTDIKSIEFTDKDGKTLKRWTF